MKPRRKARFQSSLNLLAHDAKSKKISSSKSSNEEPILLNQLYSHSPNMDMRPQLNKFAKSFKIGERFLSQETFYLGDTPGPGSYNLDLPSKKPQNMHLIEARYEDKIDDIPGPGAYEDTSYKIKGGLLPQGSVNRTEWLESSIYSPGPGKYENDDELEKPKPRGRNVMAIGHFIIKLKQFKNPEEARTEINKYPDLRNIIEEISDLIVTNKPENPMEFLRTYFNNTDKKKSEVTLSQRTPQKKKHFVGDIDVSILYD